LQNQVKQKILGTNCFNCLWIGHETKNVRLDELNNEGGIDPQTKEEMIKAKQADLITLPGSVKEDAEGKRLCNHPNIKMYVTQRMCCSYWDNAQVKRPWNK
jgi:hypothetical protein